jgi:hypothetical protein
LKSHQNEILGLKMEKPIKTKRIGQETTVDQRFSTFLNKGKQMDD